MVRVRGGSASAGRTFRLRDEDVEIVEPSTRVSKKRTGTRGGKAKQPAKKIQDAPTADPSPVQVEAHQTEEQIAEEQQTPEPSTRKSPRTRSGAQTTGSSAKQSAKRKRTSKEPEAQPVKEPTPLPKFIDDEARDRFELISQKGFIIQRSVIPYEFRKIDLEPVLKLFEFQKWTHLLTIPHTFYPDMLYQFFANLRKGNSHTELISRVNSVDITLTPDVINSVLKTKIEDGFRGKIANFFSYEEFPSAYHHFHISKLMTYFRTHFNTPAEARLEDLSPQNLIIFTIVSNLLVPTDGHRTDANKMELYLFYCFVEKIRINFGFGMCKFLLNISTDSRRKLSYEKFLTPIFAHLEIPFTGKSPRDSASTVFSKAYFERKNLKFFEGHWCHKEPLSEFRRKSLHETPVTPRTPRDQSMYISPFTIHPRKSANKSFVYNSEVITLLEDLKQHVMLIEDGLMSTMTPDQQASFIEK